MNSKNLIIFLTLAVSIEGFSFAISSLQPAIPFFSIRSQGVNTVRDFNAHHSTYPSNKHYFYDIATTIELNRSFKPNDITYSLFGNDACQNKDTKCINISGSTAENRGPKDWLADYFGLPSDFKSTISFKPTIQNIIADISLYAGFNIDKKTTNYLRISLPLVHTKWNLNFCEYVTYPGVQASLPGSFIASQCSSALSRSLLFTNATAFFSGEKINEIHPLTANKWALDYSSGNNNKILAQLNAEYGWSFLVSDDYRFGFHLRVGAPTGTRPTGEYLFEPIIGNGHHWEIGGGISAHALLWKGCNDHTLTSSLQANITHLCTTPQTRVFDLYGKPNSRYMLAQRLGPNLESLSGCDSETYENPTLSQNQLVVSLNNAGDFTSVANLTKSQVKVGIAAQADISLRLSYTTSENFEWNIGYNIWARSCEKISRVLCRAQHPLANDKTWALKGDAITFGMSSDNRTFKQLAATQHSATIHSGTNGFVAGSLDSDENQYAQTNPGIDYGQFACEDSDRLQATTLNTQPIKTSIQPVFISENDIDMRGTSAFSQKIFTHITYTCPPIKEIQSFIEAGASIEFGGKNLSCPYTYHATGISQWGLWLKLGINFDNTSLCSQIPYKEKKAFKVPFNKKTRYVPSQETIHKNYQDLNTFIKKHF